jgi:hypothetical protein
LQLTISNFTSAFSNTKVRVGVVVAVGRAGVVGVLRRGGWAAIVGKLAEAAIDPMARHRMRIDFFNMLRDRIAKKSMESVWETKG